MLQKQNSTTSPYLRLLGVLCCLLPFLLGQFQQVVRHQLEHSHQYAEQHSATQEADACHRSIFHKGAADDCGHPEHLLKLEQKCSLCDSLLIPLHFALRELLPAIPELPSSVCFYYFIETSLQSLHAPVARGPPFRLLLHWT